MHILMVDDDVGDIGLLQHFFQRAHPSIEFSSIIEPEQVLPTLRRLRDAAPEQLPEVILLDINMPLMSGFEVQESLQQEATLRDIPVVFLTTSEYSEDIKKAYALGANLFITKPYDLEGIESLTTSLYSFYRNQREVLSQTA